MATYSKFLSLMTGFDRQVDLSSVSNALGLADLQLLGSTSGTLDMKASATTTSYTLTWPAAAAGANGYALTSTTGGVLSWSASSGGTVTSVSQADGSTTPIFSYSGSPVTSSGTLTQTLLTQTANTVFAGPASAGPTQPTFRALVIADIPSLSSLYLALTGGTMSGAINMGGNQINDLVMASTPASTDVVNVNYVQAVLQGLNPKNSVKAATTAALSTVTYSNGTAGVGATLTATANGALTVDGYAVQLNDRVLVKNQASGLQNGIYYISTLGTGSVPFVLTRTLDCDSSTSTPPSVESGIWTFVEATSTTLGNQGWMLTTPDPITMGTTSLTWTQFYAQGEYIFGNGFTVSGVNISVNLLSTGGLSFSGTAIQIALAANSGLSTSSSGLTTNYDNSTIGVNGSNQLYVPNAGITKTQINTNVFDQLTITGGAGTSASVANAPALSRTLIAGQSFSANVSYAVRWGITANSETAGRVYAADITTSSYDLFYVIGMASSTSAVSAGGTITVTERGDFALSSGDTAFSASTDGLAVFLQSGGTLGSTPQTAPSTSGQAVTRLGIIKFRSATNTLCIIDVDPAPVGVN